MEENESADFRKGMIITGDFAPGKSLITNFFRDIMPSQCLQFDGRNVNLFNDRHLLRHLTSEHKLIIIDDVLSIKLIEASFSLLNSQIQVNPIGRHPFETPSPQIVITTNISFEKLTSNAPISRRFHIIQSLQCGYAPIDRSCLAEFDVYAEVIGLKKGGLFPIKELYDQFNHHYTNKPVHLKLFRLSLNSWAWKNGIAINPNGRMVSKVNRIVMEFIYLKKAAQ